MFSLLGRVDHVTDGPSLPVTSGKALIAQNKGGGHGELGYHLALKLIEKDISVTLLQDGAGKNRDKQPFARCLWRTHVTDLFHFPRNQFTFVVVRLYCAIGHIVMSLHARGRITKLFSQSTKEMPQNIRACRTRRTRR